MSRIVGRVAYLASRWRGPAARFRVIHDHNLWGDDESRSGEGSRRDSPGVAAALAALEAVHDRTGFASIADVACGDANWIMAFLDAHRGIDYAGFDIVPALVAANQRRHPGRRFARLDIVSQVPPAADLVFVRDLFNHLTTREIAQALANIVASGSTWLLASNNFGHANRQLPRLSIRTSRHFDLTAAPFGLPAPDWQQGDLGLWRTDAVAAALDGAPR